MISVLRGERGRHARIAPPPIIVPHLATGLLIICVYANMDVLVMFDLIRGRGLHQKLRMTMYLCYKVDIESSIQCVPVRPDQPSDFKQI